MIDRYLAKEIKELMNYYPVVTLTGPRQSGKTTLVKKIFPEYRYVTMENPDTKQLAESDPKGFLEQFISTGGVIDEMQRAPELFSYLQEIVDEHNKEGMFVLTGSQNFLLLEKITQTLAGRTAIIKLFPFDYHEMIQGAIAEKRLNKMVLQGCYPRLYDKNIPPEKFYPFYIQTYVERDVKLIRNITNQTTFVKFIKLCAGRAGQILNISNLANDCDIKHDTAKAWLSLLEASYIVFLLQPYHKNFSKRIIKSPKLYFYDSGLLNSLLGIKTEEHLTQHYNYGAIIENYIIADILKRIHHKQLSHTLYYWRSKTGKEVDLIIEKAQKLVLLEIKSGKTMSTDYFKNIYYFNKVSGTEHEDSYVMFGGDSSFNKPKNKYISWSDDGFIDKLLQ